MKQFSSQMMYRLLRTISDARNLYTVDDLSVLITAYREDQQYCIEGYVFTLDGTIEMAWDVEGKALDEKHNINIFES